MTGTKGTTLLDFTREPPGHQAGEGSLEDAWDEYRERHDPPAAVILVDGVQLRCGPCDLFDNREAAWSWYRGLVTLYQRGLRST